MQTPTLPTKPARPTITKPAKPAIAKLAKVCLLVSCTILASQHGTAQDGTVTLSPGAVSLTKLAGIPTASLLGRTAPGVGSPEVLSMGAVTTLLHLPAFDVRAFGALCNNAADDQTAIMAAITAAQSTGYGGRVLISGRCRHSGTISITGSNVHIAGEGIGASQLISTSPTLDQVVFTGTTSSDISSLSILSAVTRTGGYALRRTGSIYADDHNLYIAPAGGNGVLYDNTGGATKLHDSMIHITGPFDGVTFVGGNDRWLDRLWIQGNFTPGSSCIVFRSTNGADLVANVECVLFGDYGVEIRPGNGESVLWTVFQNVYCDQDNMGGWMIAPTGTGTVNGLTCNTCWAGTNGLSSSTANGFTITGPGVDGVSFTDIRSVNNGGHGVSITDGAAHVALMGGYISGNSQQQVGLRDGISITNTAGGVRVQGVNNVAYGPPRHRYSISIANADNYQILGNDFRGYVTGAILNTPGTSASRIVNDNL